MRLSTLLAIMGLAVAGQIFVSLRAEATTAAIRQAYWQVNVRQAQGRLARGLRPPEEGARTTSSRAAFTDGAGLPSCHPSNSSSPDCYAATQQPTPEGDILTSVEAARAMTVLRPAAMPVPSKVAPSAVTAK